MVSRNTPKSAPQVWSVIIAGAGFALLATIEIASAVYAFNTGDQAIKVLGLPLDAVLKTVASVIVAVAAFGGAIVATAKRGKGRTLAYAMTALCFGWTAVNFSGFTSWARASSEAAAVRESVLYKEALVTIKTPAEGFAEFEARDKAEAVIRTGEAPTNADRQFGDWLRALAAIGLVWGFASAFRLPAPVAQPKAKRNPASETAKAGWEGERGQQRRAAIKARHAKPKLHAVK